MQFLDGGNYLGAPVTVNTGTGVATYSTTALGVATHEITADYSGHFQYAASSTAAPISQQVVQAQLTVRAVKCSVPRTPPTRIRFPIRSPASRMVRTSARRE